MLSPFIELGHSQNQQQSYNKEFEVSLFGKHLYG